MTKKKTIFQDARDLFEQGLQSVKNLSRFLSGTSRDKRTIKSTQKAFKELSEGRRAKDIGEQLGIPYQRVAVLRKKIEAGEAYSPELRDIVKEAAQEYNEKPQKLDGGVMYFPNKEKLQNSVNHIEVVKTFPELEDARRYWKRIINSDKYIGITSITKKGQKFYQVVGMGKRSQRPYKGKIQDHRARNRIDDIIAKYPKAKS